MGIIRFLLASFVVLYHCGQFKGVTFMQGEEAVQSFYIISGFYMALILHEKYHLQVNAYKLFITNRLLKLMPIYWLLLLMMLFISIVLYVTTKGNDWAFFHSYKNQPLSFGTGLYLLLSNLFIVGQDVALYLGMHPNGQLYFTSFYEQSHPPVYSFMLVPQAWTISIEIMFYLIVPFFVRKKVVFIAFLALLALGIKWYLRHKGLVYDPWTYRFFPAEMFYFLLGILSYKLYAATKQMLLPKWVLQTALLGTIAVIVGFEMLLLQFHRYLFFISFALVIPLIFRATKHSRWDRVIGEYSYPIYIAHVFFKSLYFMIFGGATNVSIPVLAASILFAFLYNEFIYKKIEHYRQQRVSQASL